MVAALLGATLLAEELTSIFVVGFAAVLTVVLLVNLRGQAQYRKSGKSENILDSGSCPVLDRGSSPE